MVQVSSWHFDQINMPLLRKASELVGFEMYSARPGHLGRNKQVGGCTYKQ